MTEQATALRAKKVVPLFCTDKIQSTKAFYTGHLGFRVIFDHESYVGLENGKGNEIAFMDPPPGHTKASGEGLFFCIEVEDVDAEHERLVSEGIEMTQEPTDNPWGDRSISFLDPNGITVYLSHPVEITDEYKAYVRE